MIGTRPIIIGHQHFDLQFYCGMPRAFRTTGDIQIKLIGLLPCHDGDAHVMQVSFLCKENGFLSLRELQIMKVQLGILLRSNLLAEDLEHLVMLNGDISCGYVNLKCAQLVQTHLFIYHSINLLLVKDCDTRCHHDFRPLASKIYLDLHITTVCCP